MTWINNLARSTIGVAAIAMLTAGLYLGEPGAQDRLPDYTAIMTVAGGFPLLCQRHTPVERATIMSRFRSPVVAYLRASCTSRTSA